MTWHGKVGWAATLCGAEWGERSAEQRVIGGGCGAVALEKATASEEESSAVFFFCEMSIAEWRRIRWSAGAQCPGGRMPLSCHYRNYNGFIHLFQSSCPVVPRRPFTFHATTQN
jgi:hypothetical protein